MSSVGAAVILGEYVSDSLSASIRHGRCLTPSARVHSTRLPAAHACGILESFAFPVRRAWRLMSRLPAVHSPPRVPPGTEEKMPQRSVRFVPEMPSLWQCFFCGKITYEGKNCDSGSEVLHVTLNPPIYDRQRNQRKISTRRTWTVPHGVPDGGLHGIHVWAASKCHSFAGCGRWGWCSHRRFCGDGL